MADPTLKVLLADEDKDELARLAGLVEAAGHRVVDLAVAVGETAEAIVEHRPDIALVLVHDDYEHAIDLVVEIRSYAEIPVVLLARAIDDDFLRMAADHSLEVLHLPSEPETVARVIQLATARHEEIQRLTHQIGEMDGILERRTSVEQAKGILMERHGVDDNEAFRMLREHARANRLRVADVAASIIAVRELLPAPSSAD